MEVYPEDVSASLKVLGLEPGATPEDVHAAFRRLARDFHPDVAGRQEALRFQRITGAYSLLKGLTAEDLTAGASPSTARQHPSRRTAEGRSLFDWYRKQQKERGGPEAGRQEGTRDGGGRQPLLQRVDRVLDQYERGVSRRLEQLEQNADTGILRHILLRLGSSVPEVRRLALSRMGALANHGEVRSALAKLLRHGEVDEETARLLCGLPLKPDTLRQLAADAAGHAANLPNALISSLLGLRNPREAADTALMERYLLSASPSGIALILRYWPKGAPPGDAALRQLLTREDAQALVPLLSTLKQNFPHAALRHRRRLTELSRHPAPAVRVWSQALLDTLPPQPA